MGLIREILAALLQNLLVFAIAWAALFIGLGYLFAGGRLGALFLGLFRILLSIVIAPFVFLRRATTDLCDHARGGDQVPEASDQYLLGKLMTLLQASVIVMSLAGLAAGLAETFQAFLPPAELRALIKVTKGELAGAEKRLGDAAQRLQVLDQEWPQARAAALARLAQQRTEEAAEARRKRVDIEQALAADSYRAKYLEDMRASLPRDIENRDRSGLDDIRRGLQRRAGDLWSWDAELPSRMRDWVEAWHRAAVAQLATRSPVEDADRGAAQPGYSDETATHARAESELATARERLKQLRTEAHFRPATAFFALLATAGGFLSAIWFLGVVLEALWMGIRLAGDVHTLRMKTDARR